jgi:putative multiple sugar transport system substrate-binding protein
MKKILALILALVMVASLCACGGSKSGGDSKTIVGILMPTKEQTIWSIQGDRLVEGFEKAGYATLIEYAEDDASKQAMQIENMITKGANVLIVVAVDGAALTDACEKAKEEGILVIAEDRLITNTDAVDYYVTFDLVKMGGLQGKHIEEKLDLANAAGPFNLEIFSGSQDDPNAKLFYQGAMEVLKPYIDSGKLVIKSGQKDYDVTAISGWATEKATSRMDDLLSGYYADAKLDAVLVAADCLAMGVVSSLEAAGYGSGDLAFPVVTGQDAELAAIKSIKAGKQTMTAFLDASKLVEIIVPLVNDLVAGKTPEATSTYNNGVKDVPAQTYSPYLISAENVDYLVEVGFYTEAEING